MGFFQRLFASPRKLGDRVAQALVAGAAEPFAGLADHDAPTAVEALGVAARQLLFEEHLDAAEAALDEAVRRSPGALLEQRLTLYRIADRPDDELAALQEAVDTHPGNPEPRERLAHLLLDLDRGAEAEALLDAAPAEDSLLLPARGRVLLESGRFDEARELLAPVAEQLHRALAGAFDDHWRALRDRLMLVEGMLEEIAVRTEGEEARVLVAAARGGLDRNAAVNYSLIGSALMARGSANPARLELQLPDADAAERAASDAPDDPAALCRAGIALLRTLRIDEARRRFARAHEQDATHFPAALGLGAAMRHAKAGVKRGLDDLPPLDADHTRLVPDWPALTPEERRVVAASVHPLRCVVPALLADGASIRVLPLDVRPSDLPELADLAGQEPGERTPDAALGLATDRLAVARVEDLLDTTSERSWVFAHELAHLALPRLPLPFVGRVVQLQQAAVDLPWAVGQYQQSNPHEFFAVGYEHWLRARYRRASAAPQDDAGVLAALFVCFDELLAADRLEQLG